MATRDSMQITPGAAGQLRTLGLDRVAAALSCQGGRYAALSLSSDTIRIAPADPADGAPPVYLKRYRYRKRSHRIKAMLRGSLLGRSRARFEFDRLTAMQAKGVPVVEPMAVGQRRIGAFVTAGILITQGAQGQSLLSFARTAQSLSPADRHAIVRALAAQVRRMHAAGAVHGSLVWRDILVRRTDGGAFAFTFLDPGRVARFYLPGCRWLGYLRDLADLAGTAMLLCGRTDRMRFAKAYLQRATLRRRDRMWLKLVAWRAKRRVDQERHRMEVNDLLIAPAKSRP